MKFNINDYMRVKLTAKGKQILEEEHNYYQSMRPEDKREPFKLNLDSDGWYREQAWCIFNTFGKYVVMGRKIPFDTEVEIENPNP